MNQRRPRGFVFFIILIIIWSCYGYLLLSGFGIELWYFAQVCFIISMIDICVMMYYLVKINWNLINIAISSSWLMVWFFYTDRSYTVYLLIGAIAYVIVCFPAILPNLRHGNTTVKEFSFQDAVAHGFFGYATSLVVADFLDRSNILAFASYPVAISMVFAVIYEGIEFVADALSKRFGRKLNDLIFDYRNSLFDLMNHAIGCIVAMVVAVHL